MIQKQTVLNSCTSSPILKVKTFHLYSKNQTVKVFSYTKNSVKLSLKKNTKLLGKKVFSFFCKQSFFYQKVDKSSDFFLKNQSVLLKKKKKIIGFFVVGSSLNNNKFLKLKNKFSKQI